MLLCLRLTTIRSLFVQLIVFTHS
uniref:Uncharacterized protein n=1 Tax=Anguilla anguilla TaxID=7936 RepID=A0A0E9R8B7_ANGAN